MTARQTVTSSPEAAARRRLDPSRARFARRYRRRGVARVLAIFMLSAAVPSAAIHCTATQDERCDAPESCPGENEPCARRVCRDHICGLIPDPRGTRVPPEEAGMSGPCRQWSCDGEGDVVCDEQPRCGDGACEADETCETCTEDCGGCQSPCGDGACDEAGGESACSCTSDCGPCCGDGHCAADAGENCAGCAQDCCP